MAQLANDVRKAAGRSLTLQMSALPNISSHLLGSQRMFEAVSSLSESIRFKTSIADAIGASFRPTITEALAQSAFPRIETEGLLSSVTVNLLQAQQHSIARIMESLALPQLGGINEIISKNNVLAAAALENVQSIFRVSVERQMNLDRLLYKGVSADLSAVAWSYRSVLDDRHLVERSANGERRDPFLSHAVVPTYAVANYTAALRSEVRGADSGLEPVSMIVADDELDSLLESIDPDFPPMRRGAWAALNSGSPDKLRQAAVSQRELVRQVFQSMFPDVQIIEGEPDSKLRGRVVAALKSDSAGDFAFSLARAVVSLYRHLNKITHTNYKHEQAVRATLIAGEGLLLFVLSQRGG
jgi:hypothetical protein